MSEVTTLLTREATYADLEALPKHLTGELIGGALYASPKPAGPHVLAATALAGELYGPFQRGRGGPGGWWILAEPELHLGGDVLVPDLAGWRRERMPQVPRTHAFDVPPDWVCEVISPATRKIDRKIKPPLYLREKIGHLWLVEPLQRQLEVFRYTPEGWLAAGVFQDDELVRAEPFAAAELELPALWGELRKPPPDER
jgi:Uma2 family endonuclease